MKDVRNRRMKSAIVEMKKVAMSEKLMELPLEIIEEAVELFKSLQEDGFKTGYSSVIDAFSCLLYIIKTDPSCPAISFKQFTEALSTNDELQPLYDPKKIFRAYRKIVGKVGIQPRTCAIRPTIFVTKFGKKMGFDEALLEKTLHLTEEAINAKVHIGKSPLTVAAAFLAVIDFQYGKKRDRREIAEICGVTDAAISNVLALPFFAGRIPRKEVKYVSKTVLLRLLRKLIKTSLNEEEPMPISSLKRRLRLSLPDELKNHQIGWKEFSSALKTLISEGQMFIVGLAGCPKLNEPQRIYCLSCPEMEFWKSCQYCRVLFKKQRISQSNNSKSAFRGAFFIYNFLIFGPSSVSSICQSISFIFLLISSADFQSPFFRYSSLIRTNSTIS